VIPFHLDERPLRRAHQQSENVGETSENKRLEALHEPDLGGRKTLHQLAGSLFSLVDARLPTVEQEHLL
jgi:hypothetical protein